MSDSPMCKNNCGFFGNSTMDFYCSKCWNEIKNYNVVIGESVNINTNNHSEQKSPKNTSRCNACNKKLGVLGGIKCRCDKHFCSLHRYASEHNCQYDYIKNDITIAKSTGGGKFEKIEKI